LPVNDTEHFAEIALAGRLPRIGRRDQRQDVEPRIRVLGNDRVTITNLRENLFRDRTDFDLGTCVGRGVVPVKSPRRRRSNQVLV